MITKIQDKNKDNLKDLKERKGIPIKKKENSREEEPKKFQYLFRHFLNKMTKLSGIKKAVRVGRGAGSGKGKTSGRGDKGQYARGQAPALRLVIKNLIRKIPKRGKPGKAVTVFTLTIEMLKNLIEKYSLTNINREIIFEKLKTPKKYLTVKLVASENITEIPAINIEIDAISKGAMEFITKNKGTVKLIPKITIDHNKKMERTE